MKQSWQWTVVLAVGFRVFVQAILLERDAYSACWLVPLVGFVLALPAVLIAARRWQQAGSTQFPTHMAGCALRWLAVALLLLDTAQMVLLFQEASQFASMSSYPSTALYLLMLLLALFVIRQNRNGVFATGSAIKGALILFVGLLTIFRIPEMHVSHLFPLLGGGVKSLLLSGLSTAGLAFQLLILLSVAPDIDPKPGAIVGMWTFACAGASALAALETMVSAIVSAEQSGIFEAIGRLLASGRTSVSLQLPLYLAWFMLHFIVVCVNLKCMAVMGAEIARHEENARLRIAAAVAVAALAIAFDHWMGGRLSTLLQWPGALRYAALALATVLLLIPQRSKREVAA